MTVDSKYDSVRTYLNDGGTEYPYPFESIGDDAVRMYKVEADGTETLLVAGLHYTVRFSDYRGSVPYRGNIVLAAPLAGGSNLRVERKTPIDNTIDYSTKTILDYRQLEYSFDKICFIEQEIEGHFCDCRGDVIEQTIPPAIPGTESPADECRPYECARLQTVLTDLSGVYAYYPMGSNGQGTPVSVGSTLFTLPALVGQDISVGTTEGFGISTPSVYADSDCVVGSALNISVDTSAPQSLGQAGEYAFTRDFGTSLLNTGANVALVMKPDNRTGSGVSILQAPNLQVATANFTGALTLPEWRFALGVSLRLDGGSSGTLRSVSITNAMQNQPNSGGGTLTLPDVIDSEDPRAVLVTATWRMENSLFEDADTDNEPAYRMHMKLRVDYDDGVFVEDEVTVWETVGFSSSVDPADVNPFTKSLTPVSTPSNSASSFVFMSASSSHPLYNDLVLYEASQFDAVRTAFLRSFSDYAPPSYCGSLTVSPN